MSRDFHFSFDAHVLQGVSLAVSVIKKQLFTSLDGSLSKNTYPVISINHHNWKERYTGVRAGSVKTGHKAVT